MFQIFNSYKIASTNYTPNNIPDPYYNNVVLLIHADGSTFIDNSGLTASLITVNNTGTAPITSTSQYKFGGSSILCTSGSNQVITQIISSPFYTIPPNTPFTIEFYFYFTYLPNNFARFIGSTIAFSVTPTWQIYYNNLTNKITLWNGTDLFSSTANPFLINTWYNIAFVYTGSTYYLFINGILNNSLISYLLF